MPHVTTRDIAKRAGVTQATISRALRNHPEISTEMCQKIQALAQEMGYRPDPMLSALMFYRQSRKTPRFQSTLGIITDTRELDAWRRGYKYGKLYYEGIVERANQLGYRIEEFSPQHMKVKSEELGKILQNRGIRGLIIPPRTPSRAFLKMDWTSFAAVTLGYSLIYPLLNRVSHNHVGATITMMRRLRQLGYRRIGFAMELSFDERVNHGYFAGFSVENNRAHLKDRIPWFIEPVIPENFFKFRRWFQKYRPDVVVAINISVFNWLLELKQRIPDDIGFVNQDFPNPTRTIPIPSKDLIVAGIHEKCKLIGSTAVDFLVGMLYRNEYGIPKDPKIMLVDGAWNDGQTVRSLVSSH